MMKARGSDRPGVISVRDGPGVSLIECRRDPVSQHRNIASYCVLAALSEADIDSFKEAGLASDCPNGWKPSLISRRKAHSYA
jgi:hypothetical protein